MSACGVQAIDVLVQILGLQLSSVSVSGHDEAIEARHAVVENCGSGGDLYATIRLDLWGGPAFSICPWHAQHVVGRHREVPGGLLQSLSLLDLQGLCHAELSLPSLPQGFLCDLHFYSY